MAFAAPAITLTPQQVIVDASSAVRLQLEFEREHCVLLEQLLAAPMLELLRPSLQRAKWSHFRHGEIGTEDVLSDDRASAILHFAINAPAVLGAIRQIARCDDITWFDGRIFRMDPGAGHHDSWHDDFMQNRLVGMSINLSFDGYDGGEFEIRHKNSDRASGRIANRIAGNASLFRLAQNLEHRVAPLSGTRARIAFAGWFRSGQPGLLARLRR